MPPVQELQQTDPYLAEVEGFATIARLHGVPTGAPECLASLPLRLSKDWRLRDNIVELLRELQRRDPEFSLPDALAVLLLAVGGPKASPNRSRLLDESVNLTAGFLASLGGWPGPAEDPITDLDHPSAEDPRLAVVYVAESEEPPAPAPSDPANDGEAPMLNEQEPVPELTEDAEPAKPDSPAGVSLSEITQALARLERGSVDLRLHLDSIDQRLSRMEPLLDSPTPTPTEAPTRSSSAPGKSEPQARTFPAEVVVERQRSESPSAPGPAVLIPPQPVAPPTDRTLVHRAELAPAISPTPRDPFPEQPTSPPRPDPSSASGSLPARPLTPRRDRFAAAMDLSGARSEFNFPARNQALPIASIAAEPTADLRATPKPQPTQELSPPPAPVEGHFNPAVQPAPSLPIAAHADRLTEDIAPLHAPVPSILVSAAALAPAPLAELATPPSLLAAGSAIQATPTPPPTEPGSPAPAVVDLQTESQPPPIESRPTEPRPIEPRPIHTADSPSPLPKHAPLDAAPLRPPVSFDFEGVSPARTSYVETDPTQAEEPTTEADEAEPTSPGPLLVGLVAALLIGIAIVLLLRGKPLPFSSLKHHTNSASLSSPDTPNPTAAAVAPYRSPSRPPTASAVAPRPPANTISHTTPPRAAASSGNDRIVEAREATPSDVGEQILAAPTFVPEAVMKSRLLSAPAPLYPKLANAVGLEGGIIFEAIIAKDGSVEGLTALGGQRLLRDAAANAVRQWRYQPFLLHGEPVEVRSIVHVNVTPSTAAESPDPQ